MTRISANRDTCQGYGNCVIACPGVFDLDDDGLVMLKRDHADGDEADALRRAVYDCPTDSISIDETAQRSG
jgi:ferredoxin